MRKVQLSSLLLLLGIYLGSVNGQGVKNDTNQNASSVLQTGYSVEMIITKLQVLEYHILKNDLQMNDRISALCANVSNLVQSVEQLIRAVQWTDETVNKVVLDGEYLGRNLSAIQRDVRDLLVEQRLLLTSQQFEEYVAERQCNASSVPNTGENSDTNYTSCRSLPLRVSGIYQIQPETPFKDPMTVLCDQDYGSGGWIVIQNRFDGAVNFYRGWQEYKNGFGNLEGEFWLGLDRIHQITASTPHELVVLLEDFDGNKTYAKYDRFEIGDEGQEYALVKIDGYSGTAGDSMSEFKAVKFSTLDHDNDSWSNSCAVTYSGAWWYAACHKSNLNGQYLRGDTEEYAKGMVWQTFRGYHHSLKSSRMMIRPKVL